MKTVIHVSAIGETANILLRPQCEYLRDAGYRMGFVFSPNDDCKTKLESDGFFVHEQYIARQITPQDASSIIRLAQYFRRERPDAVHTHTSKGGIVGRVAARLAGVPHIIHTIHGLPFIEGQNWLKYNVYLNIERWAASFTEVLLSQNVDDVQTATDCKIKAKWGLPIHISNGVDIARFDMARLSAERSSRRSEFKIGQVPVITIVARQAVEKGYLELIRALGQLLDCEWTALFVGPDEGLGDEIKKQIKLNRLEDRVRILGMRRDIDSILSISDVYVLPSYREGVPRTVIEAQSMGVPAVVTNIRGCRDVIRDGVNGFLVPPQDDKNLALAIRKLIVDSELRASMGENARRIVEETFDERIVFGKIAAVYEKAFSK